MKNYGRASVAMRHMKRVVSSAGTKLRGDVLSPTLAREDAPPEKPQQLFLAATGGPNVDEMQKVHAKINAIG